jgi:hypothetical protein
VVWLVDSAVELVLLGAECPEERAFAGSLGAAAGAQRFGRAVAAAMLDAGPGRCRVTAVDPAADANALHAALKQAAGRGGRLLVVYLAGQLAWDPRRRRPVVVTAGSLRENAASRGLPCEWVVSAMAHSGQAERLLVLDAVADSAVWQDWQPEELRRQLPAWGRLVRQESSRRGRAESGGSAGGFAALLADALEQGVPGAPAALDPYALQPALDRADAPGARWVGPPPESRLLLRNRAALRGVLGPRSRPGLPTT